MLLVYLSLEGEKPRRYIADLFWSGRANQKQRLNNLSRILSDLRKYAPGTFGASQTHVWTKLTSDVLELRRALHRSDYGEVARLYRGPFLEGHLSGWGAELEEWIDEQRRLSAQQMQEACLALAEWEASQRRFGCGAARVQQAYELSGALEPDLFERFYTLLAAAEHPLASTLQRDMADYDLELSLSKEEARLHLSPTFIGRERELARLRGSERGAWVWLRGAKGTGKTSLLKRLPGTFLPARSSAPFATLEPLLRDVHLGTSAREAQTQLLQALRQREGTWLIDDWNEVDLQSRALLASLYRARPDLRVIVAGEGPPPFALDAVVELTPLSPEALAAHPGAWDKTGGLPTLVHAYLQGAPLERVLDTHLAPLSEDARRVFFALALLTSPCPALVRRALGLSAAALTRALDTLLEVNLIAPSGQVRARDTARAYLNAHPSQLSPLVFNLACCVEPAEAFALYEQTRAFWRAADKPDIRRAYSAYAERLREQGNLEQAHIVLLKAPSEVDSLHHTALAEMSLEAEARERPHVIERRFPRWWVAVHVAGFLLIALFSSRGTADSVATSGIALTTLLVLGALLYLGWRLVRLETSSIRWSGVGAAATVGCALTLVTFRPGHLEGLMCLGSVATVVGTGATLGALKGPRAGLIGSGFAAVGALFAAVQLAWGSDVGLLSELGMSLVAMQLVLGAGAALWAYLLALIILSSLKPGSLFATK